MAIQTTPGSFSAWIKQRSDELGFSACGISQAEFLVEEKERLQSWLQDGMHGEMGYMERNPDKRLDPRLLVEGARSVISLLYRYFPSEKLSPENNYIISKYAYGKDYHTVIRDKLHSFIAEIRKTAGPLQARAFTDSAPVLERAWASRSGLGWIGKNTCLIHPKLGSFFFIAEIITDLELEPDKHTVNDLCGGCSRCLEHCPTGALEKPRILDSRKCISYLTIEYKGLLPVEMKDAFGEMIFGCDICQDVCPWNRFSRPHREPLFNPSPGLRTMDKEKWENMTGEEFVNLFTGTALERLGNRGLKRNVEFLGKQG